ncbi:MAG: hypothetical protein JWQ18_2137 [Conexibacter sp.]|nr:hypothetical protein [Conexibacter sp.]
MTIHDRRRALVVAAYILFALIWIALTIFDTLDWLKIAVAIGWLGLAAANLRMATDPNARRLKPFLSKVGNVFRQLLTL